LPRLGRREGSFLRREDQPALFPRPCKKITAAGVSHFWSPPGAFTDDEVDMAAGKIDRREVFRNAGATAVNGKGLIIIILQHHSKSRYFGLIIE